MPLSVPESRVLELWQTTIKDRPDLVTEENEPLKIIYPGRLNDGRGADLRDAVIATRHGLLQGDIEIHVKSSDWWAHGHHEDKAYNPVILHVVYRHDAGKETVLQNGMEVPTLALDEYAEEQAGQRVTSAFSPVIPPPCHAGPVLSKVLDEAGDTRFMIKKESFRRVIIEKGPAQALYGGIMTALGYSQNKTAMAGLAGIVPLRGLEEIASGVKTDNGCLLQLQAILLGAAGLLPSQRFIKRPPGSPPDEYEIILERQWVKTGEKAGMSADDWRFFKVRPGNYPVRRIAAMCYLLVRYRDGGILKGLKTALEETIEDNARTLEESLAVDADGYWRRYLDFGLPVSGTAPALVGRERAAEIVLNVLLPFYAAASGAAYAVPGAQPGLEEKTLDIFHRYRAPSENSLERHVRKQFGMAPETAATARRRQGLIHIYKTFCTQGRCGECMLGRVERKDTITKKQ